MQSDESNQLNEELDKKIEEVRKELKGQVVEPDFMVPLKSVQFTPFNQAEVQKKRKEDRITTREARIYKSSKKIYLTKKQRKRGETPWTKYSRSI